jgi:putative (di)nucleoside polyphosphate hydrolase
MPDRKSKLHEPSLEEMLADPIVWMVMKSDRVEKDELRSMLTRVAADLAAGSTHALSSSAAIGSSGAYRRGVGIMLLNNQNQVFVGKRVDTEGEAWQMPQGGIDEDEEPRDAAFRELREEIGADNARVIAESKTWLRYELPPELRKRWGDRWEGQQQKWFVMRFRGADADINIDTEHPEFSGWKWVSIEHLPNLIVVFKRQLYIDLLAELQSTGII